MKSLWEISWKTLGNLYFVSLFLFNFIVLKNLSLFCNFLFAIIALSFTGYSMALHPYPYYGQFYKKSFSEPMLHGFRKFLMLNAFFLCTLKKSFSKLLCILPKTQSNHEFYWLKMEKLHFFKKPKGGPKFFYIFPSSYHFCTIWKGTYCILNKFEFMIFATR